MPNLRDTPKEQQCELLGLQINKFELISLEGLFSICGFGFAVLCFFFCLRCLFAFNYPGPSSSQPLKLPVPASRQQHTIVMQLQMGAGGCSFFKNPPVLHSNELFLVCPPHSKATALAVWLPLLWSGDCSLFHRSSGGSKQSLPDVGFITSSGTTTFLYGKPGF